MSSPCGNTVCRSEPANFLYALVWPLRHECNRLFSHSVLERFSQQWNAFSEKGAPDGSPRR
jgi:hypothetical protein